MGQYSSKTSGLTREKKMQPTLSSRVDYKVDSPRFSAQNERELREGIEHLNEHGYAVFADVLSSDEINKNMDLFWKHLENLPQPSAIRRDNAQTWSTGWPGASTVGLLPDHGIGQSEFMWAVRGNPSVKKVFTQIWETSELLVSFDGAGCFRDWRLNRAWKTASGWFHCDQHPLQKPNRCSIQGLVSITDSTESTGGLVVVPGSHKHFAELESLVSNNDRQNDFVRVPPQHPLVERLQSRLIKCKAGDLIVWDSRCIHCNTPALDDEETRKTTSSTKENSSQLLRVVAYVCMSPTSMVKNDDLKDFREAREKLVRDKVTCTHWPHELRISGLPKEDDRKVPLTLSAYQHSLIIGIDITPNDKAIEDVIL